MQRAKIAGWRISFDTNYRSKLWSGAEAAEGCERAMQLADVIFCPLDDYCVMYGKAGTDAAIAGLAERFPDTLIVMTMGGDGSAARLPDGEVPAAASLSGGRCRTHWRAADAFAAGIPLCLAAA